MPSSRGSDCIIDGRKETDSQVMCAFQQKTRTLQCRKLYAGRKPSLQACSIQHYNGIATTISQHHVLVEFWRKACGLAKKEIQRLEVEEERTQFSSFVKESYAIRLVLQPTCCVMMVVPAMLSDDRGTLAKKNEPGM